MEGAGRGGIGSLSGGRDDQPAFGANNPFAGPALSGMSMAAKRFIPAGLGALPLLGVAGGCELDYSNPNIMGHVVGRICDLAKTQFGSRFLQDRIDAQDDRYTSIIFNEVYAHFAELIVNLFGSYLCQKLMEASPEQQRTMLWAKLSPDMVRVVAGGSCRCCIHLMSASTVHLFTICLVPALP